MSNLSVSTWINALYKRQISEDLRRWQIQLEWSDRNFHCFYLACQDAEYDALASYIRKKLGIEKSCVKKIIVDPKCIDIVRELLELQESIQRLQCKRVLILAHGFEGIIKRVMASNGSDYVLSRAGHDYDQNVFESRELEGAYRGIKKKIVILTHVGYSFGNEVYDVAFRSALGSQFRDGIIEIRHDTISLP